MEVQPTEDFSRNGADASTSPKDLNAPLFTTSIGDDTQSQFWHTPPADEQGQPSWHTPPLPVGRRILEELSPLLQKATAILRDQKANLRAVDLEWQFKTRPRAAEVELEHLCKEVAGQIEVTQKKREEAQESFAKAMALAGLVWFPETEPTIHPGGLANPFAKPVPKPSPSSIDNITARDVESALDHALPKPEELAGKYHVEPVIMKPGEHWWHKVFAVMPGLLVAVCLGSLIGLVKLNDLMSHAGSIKLVFALGIGMVIVLLMGEGVSYICLSLARLREPEPGEAGPVPRHQGNVIVNCLAIAMLTLIAAEIFVEAFGLRQLHLQQLHSMGIEADNLFLPEYFLIGAIVSGPYLIASASRGWAESERSLRAAWLQHKQYDLRCERLREDAVQEALLTAHQIEMLTQKLKTMYALSDAARAAAVGEAASFQHYWQQMVETFEPLESGGTGRRGANPFNLFARRNRRPSQGLRPQVGFVPAPAGSRDEDDINLPGQGRLR